MKTMPQCMSLLHHYGAFSTKLADVCGVCAVDMHKPELRKKIQVWKNWFELQSRSTVCTLTCSKSYMYLQIL